MNINLEIDDPFFECVMHTKSTDNLGNETLIDKYGEPIVFKKLKRVLTKEQLKTEETLIIKFNTRKSNI